MQLLLLLLLHFTVAAVCLAATALESVSALPLSSSYSSSAAFVSASLAGRPRPSSRALGNDDDEFDPIPAELDACRRANPQESFVWCAAAILGGKATRAAVEQARTDPTTAPSPLAALSSEEAILLEEFAAELLRDQYSRIGTLAAAATAASTIKLSAALDPAPRPAPAVAMDQQSELTTDSVLRASGLDRFSEKVPSDAYSSRIEFGPAPTPTPIFASDSFHPSPLDTSFVADVAALYTPLPDSDGEHSPAPTSYTQGLMSAIARRVVEGGDSDTHSAMPTDPDLLGQVRKQLRGELMEQSIHVEPADEAPSRVGSVLDCFVSTALGGKLGEESNETSHFLPTTGLHRALMVAHGDVSMVTLHDRDFRQSNELRIQDITILFAPSMRRLVEEGARCSGMGGMLGTPSSGSEDPVVSGAKGDLILLTPHSVVLSIGIPPQSVRVSEPLSELDMPLTMEGAQFWLDHSVWLEQAVGDALPSLWPVAWEHADIEGSATPGPRVQPRGSDDEFSASHFFKGKRVDTNSRDMHRHLKSAVLLHMLGQLELLSGDASQAHMALSEACHIAVRFSNSLRNGGVARQQCFGSLAQALAALGRNDDAAEARSVSQRRKVSTRQMSEMLKRFSVRAALVNPLLSDSNFSVQSHHAVAVWSMIGSVMHAFNVHTAEDAVVLVVQWCLIGVTLHWWWTGSIPGFAIGWGPGKLEKSKSTTFRRRRTKSRGCCNERHSKAKKAQWRPSQVAKIGRCWIDDCKSFAERVCVSACERWSTSAQTVPKPQAKTRQKATRLPAVTTKDSVTPALQNDQHPANIFQESHETQGVVRPRDNDDAAAYADDEAVSGKASIASTASRSTQTATLEKRSDEHAKQKRKPKRRLTRIDRTCERGPSPASTASKVAETECGARSQEVSNLVKSPIDELEALRNENNALRMQLLETQLHLRQEQVRMQMEFYLSDTNVVKDVFLQRHMDEFGFVPLEVFMSFPRIRAITSRLNDMVNAVSQSTLLQLHVDEVNSGTFVAYVRNPRSRCVVGKHARYFTRL